MVVTSGAENQRAHQGPGKRGQNPVRCQSVTLFPRGLHISIHMSDQLKLKRVNVDRSIQRYGFFENCLQISTDRYREDYFYNASYGTCAGHMEDMILLQYDIDTKHIH